MLCFKLIFFDPSFCKYKNVRALVVTIMCVYHLSITETQKTEHNRNVTKKKKNILEILNNS